MLIRNENDSEEELVALASYLVQAAPRTAYLAIPTRPPAFTNVQAADEAAVHPMRRDAVLALMSKSNATDEQLEKLIVGGLVSKILYNNQDCCTTTVRMTLNRRTVRLSFFPLPSSAAFHCSLNW